MTELTIIILRQIAYVRSVRDIMHAIIARMLGGDWVMRVFESSDEDFNGKLDKAFMGMDERSATKSDYCRAVTDILCGEVERLCSALMDVCDASGYREYFDAHVSKERLVRLALDCDTAKLCRMKRLVETTGLGVVDILRGIGGELNDAPVEERAARSARELQGEIRGFAETTIRAIGCVGEKIGEKVEKVGEKVDALSLRARSGGKNCKYDAETIAFCRAAMDAARSNEAIKSGLNTRVTHEAVFAYNRSELESRGVADADEFELVLRASQARERRKREKALEASRGSADAADRNREYAGHSPETRGNATTLKTTPMTTLKTAGTTLKETGTTLKPAKTTLKTTPKGTALKLVAAIMDDRSVTINRLMEIVGLSRDGVNYQLRSLKKTFGLMRIGGRKSGHWEFVAMPSKIKKWVNFSCIRWLR